MHTFKAEELLAFLNENKGEVIYLEDVHNEYWTLVFRKTVMGRPKQADSPPIIMPRSPEPIIPPLGFPARDE